MKNKLKAGLLMLCLCAGLAVTVPAQAADSPPQPSKAAIQKAKSEGFDKPLVDTSTLTVTTDSGKTVMHKSVTATPTPAASADSGQKRIGFLKGTWHAKKVRGCVTADNSQSARTLIGFHAWTYITRLHYCWNKHKRRLYHVRSTYDLDAVSSFHWDGFVWQHRWWFRKWPHKKHSGRVWDNKAMITNVIPIWGTTGTWYPVNEIHAYGNGNVLMEHWRL